MSIRKSDGEFVCECEDCGDKEYGGTTEEFRDFVEELKRDGWRVRKDGDQWLHICPTCSEGT